MRKFLSLLSCIALALTFLQSPFMHVHESEENEHHSASVMHTHFSHMEKPSNKPTVRANDPDDDAHDLSWFSVAADHFVLHFALALQTYSFEEQAEASGPFHPIEIENGHDPPNLSQSSPRGPPQA